MKTLVVLTQYKRNNLEKQLSQIYNQTIRPDYVVVFQNENHEDISILKSKYNFIHIKSDYNTKFFGRFAYCFTFPVDICFVLDDDIIPGNNCLKHYMDQCISLNAIIGGNGRIAMNNPNKGRIKQPPDVGIRLENQLVDFVGHLWCFKKDWLHHMFGTKPFTFDTGEDMHFCFTSKLFGNIKSFTAKQTSYDDMADITHNKLARDPHASYVTTPKSLRFDTEKYFMDRFDIKFIESN